MKTKRIALLVAVLFVFGLFVTACGDNSSSPPPSEPADTGNPSPDPTGGTLINEPKGPANVDPVPAGAVDFSDGKMGFIAINLIPGDAGDADLSIVDFDGRKALKIEPVDTKNPYVGIDVSSMFGDKVSDIRKIEVRIFTENPDGKFHAAAGYLDVYTGANNEKSEFLWGVALERNNPRVLNAELDADAVFTSGAKNIIVLRKSDDNATKAGERQATLYVDYIAFYDASGNIMTADTSAGFDAPAGFVSADMSFLYDIADEVAFDIGGDGSVSGFDSSLLTSGSVITVGYSSARSPALVIGGVDVLPSMTNPSGNIAQYHYEDITGAYGDDFSGIDSISFSDRASGLTIKNFSIGQRAQDYVKFLPVRMGDEGVRSIYLLNNLLVPTPAAWANLFRVDTGVYDDGQPADLDPAWFQPGGYVTILFKYLSDPNLDESEVSPTVVLQRHGSFMPAGEVWYRSPYTENCDWTMGVAQWEVSELIEGWEAGSLFQPQGGPLTEELTAFWVAPSFVPIELFDVVITTPIS